MLWFFEKHQSRLHFEIRLQTDGPHCELVITFPDGRQEIESFPTADAVVRRSAALQSSLAEAGWQSPRPARGLRLV